MFLGNIPVAAASAVALAPPDGRGSYSAASWALVSTARSPRALKELKSNFIYSFSNINNNKSLK
jgi:hypothetical protein